MTFYQFLSPFFIPVFSSTVISGQGFSEYQINKSKEAGPHPAFAVGYELTLGLQSNMAYREYFKVTLKTFGC